VTKVYHDEGQPLPAEFGQLVLIDEDPHTFNILQCPNCETYYTYEYKCVNNIYDAIDLSVVERITTESAQRLMKMGADNDRKARASHLSRVAKKYGASGKRLSKDETRVIEYLVRRRMARMWSTLEAIEDWLELSAPELESIVERLLARHIIERESNHIRINPNV
jgi:hypothetical protein